MQYLTPRSCRKSKTKRLSQDQRSEPCEGPLWAKENPAARWTGRVSLSAMLIAAASDLGGVANLG